MINHLFVSRGHLNQSQQSLLIGGFAGDNGSDITGRGQSGAPDHGRHLNWLVVVMGRWEEKAEVILGLCGVNSNWEVRYRKWLAGVRKRHPV